MKLYKRTHQPISHYASIYPDNLNCFRYPTIWFQTVDLIKLFHTKAANLHKQLSLSAYKLILLPLKVIQALCYISFVSLVINPTGSDISLKGSFMSFVPSYINWISYSISSVPSGISFVPSGISFAPSGISFVPSGIRLEGYVICLVGY